MKNALTLFILIPVLVLSGCSIANNNQEEVENKNAEDVSSSISEHLISADQITEMKELMEMNGESLDGLQAYRLEKDEIGMTHIRFNFYVNDVKADETIYHFKSDGTLASITNKPDASKYSNISTIPKITKSQAISIARKKIKDSGLNAVLEFWHNTSGGYETSQVMLAWRVQADKTYPYIVIDAQNGETLYFDDGIRY